MGKRKSSSPAQKGKWLVQLEWHSDDYKRPETTIEQIGVFPSKETAVLEGVAVHLPKLRDEGVEDENWPAVLAAAEALVGGKCTKEEYDQKVETYLGKAEFTSKSSGVRLCVEPAEEAKPSPLREVKKRVKDVIEELRQRDSSE